MVFHFFTFVVDVRISPEFCFKPITFHYDENNIHLGLFFQPWLSTKQSKNIGAKYRIIHRFFDLNLPSDNPQELVKNDEEENAEENEEGESNTNTNSMPSVSELYSRLRDAHEKDNTELIHHPSMPSYFVPELRSYQLKALQWMLNREKSPKYSRPEFVPITCHSIPHQRFYFNYRTVELMDYDPGSSKIPTGGILADEMGLGKTVEMLALILSNPNLKRKRMDSSNENAGKSQECKQNLKKKKLLIFRHIQCCRRIY